MNLLKKINQLKAFRNLNAKEFSWVLYDVGNSAYTMLACALIPIWFKNVAIGEGAGHISADKATAYYSLSIAVVTIIVALIGPLCGALADRKDSKKIFFNTSVALGVGCCILNGFMSGWISFLIMYVLTKIFYNASLIFYDSMLVDVTTDERMDEVSSYGYAWGHIGSCIPFIMSLIAYILGPDMVGLWSESLSKIVGYSVTGIWWLIVTLPLIKNYQQNNYVKSTNASVTKSFLKLSTRLKKIFTDEKKVCVFLFAFFLYIDGVGTIIDNCINIGTDLNLNTVGQVVFLLGTQVVAFAGSLVFAKLSKKYSTVTLICICIAGYFAVCVYALTLKTLWDFGVLAFGVGCFQGSIQSLSRSYYSKIIPAENAGEYFGIYDIFAKGASCLGSVVIAVVKLMGGTINVAVACMAFFFAGGFVLLMIADRMSTAKSGRKA